jgi:mono/diheme cytochrome c family protein
MADGKGGTGAGTIPALANNPRLGAAAYPVLLVVKGRGAMPGLTDLLGPAQIAGVATYVRTHFGNNFTKPVTVDDVKPYLPAGK